jgi:hypothetical protein
MTRLFSVLMEALVAAAKLLPGVPGAKFRLLPQQNPDLLLDVSTWHVP